MDPTIWGPHYWFVLHTMAFHYPIHPTSIQKKIYHRFIHNLHEFLPNRTIGSQFQKLLADYPVTPYLDTRKDFIKWMHFMHNKVNERLEKPALSIEDHYREMTQKPNRGYKWVKVLCGLVFIWSIFRFLQRYQEQTK